MVVNSKVKYANVDIDEDLRRVVTYPSELQTDLYEARFWVEAPYEIVELHDKKWIVPVNRDKAKDQRDRSIISVDYDPFDEPYLFLKAAKVDTDSEESILDFCNEYGLFRNKPVLTFSNKPPAERRLPLDFFIEKIQGIKKTLRKIDAIQRNDSYEINKFKEDSINAVEEIRKIRLNEVDEEIEGIKKYKTEDEKKDPKLKEFYRVYTEKTNKQPYDPDKHLQVCLEWKDEINQTFDKIAKDMRAKMESQDGLLMLKQSVVKTINSEIESVFPTLKIGLNGEFVPGYTSNSLLGVIYLQISEMMRKSQPLEKCLHCGSHFVPLRKAGVKFCPSDTPGKRSKCQNRYDQMKYKAKNSILSGEKSIEDVCRQTGRSFTEVSSWVEDEVKH